MKELPEDIQKKWYNVVRRLQAEAKSRGLSIVTLKVLVSADGTPVTWEVRKHILEPKGLQNDLLELVDLDAEG